MAAALRAALLPALHGRFRSDIVTGYVPHLGFGAASDVYRSIWTPLNIRLGGPGAGRHHPLGAGRRAGQPQRSDRHLGL